jgi:hypothetical protein
MRVKEELPKAYAALKAYAAAHPDEGIDPDALYGLEFQVKSGFAPHQSAKSEYLTRAWYFKGVVTMFSGAVQATRNEPLAETLIHEFRHSMPANRRLATPAALKMEYKNRPHEKDARDFARKVMMYYKQ